jgi:predicted amidohydrolase
MTQPIVAALQMTSLADVGRNLATARRLLREARDQGACLAVLPENFSFMGRNEAERRAIVERDGDGPAQSAMAAAAKELGLWIVAGTQPIEVPGDSPARGALRQDPPVRRRPAGRARRLP